MKKLLPLIVLSAILFVPKLAFAGTLTDPCFPIVFCPAGQDAYAGSCQAELNSVSGAAPSCASVNGAAPVGKFWAFSCDAGCYLNSSGTGSVDPCPGGLMVGGNCLIKLNVVDDSVPVTGEKAYKIWDGVSLTEVVHLNTAGCPNNEIPVSDSTSATGWKCGNGANSGLWTTDGTNVWRPAGNVGIGTATPGAKLDVEMTTGGAATIGSSTNSATGNFAIALGNSNTASGASSVALGDLTSATNFYATAMGNTTIASGDSSTAMGKGTSAQGRTSTAMGDNAIASGDISTAMGNQTAANSYLEVAIGRYNVTVGAPAYSATAWVGTDPLFVVGNGASALLPANALTVLKNGNVGIGTATPTTKLDVAGAVNATQYCLGAGACVTGWPVQNFGWFVGISGTPVNGTLNGLPNGYSNANSQCIAAYAGSHICTADEMISSYNNTPGGPIAALAQSVWVNSGPPSYIVNVTNDCEGWKSNSSTTFGYVWDGVKDASYVTPCNMTRKIACCK